MSFPSQFSCIFSFIATHPESTRLGFLRRLVITSRMLHPTNPPINPSVPVPSRSIPSFVAVVYPSFHTFRFLSFIVSHRHRIHISAGTACCVPFTPIPQPHFLHFTHSVVSLPFLCCFTHAHFHLHLSQCDPSPTLSSSPAFIIQCYHPPVPSPHSILSKPPFASTYNHFTYTRYLLPLPPSPLNLPPPLPSPSRIP